MTDFRLADAQADMRSGYLCGAPGIAASSTAWLTAAGVALYVSASTSVWTLLIAGAFIHPVGVLITKAFGGPAAHQPGNPLERLAIEGTFWMLASIAVAFGISVLRVEWFFPAMLLIIGGRYLTFQSMYGLRIYWFLGGTLCAAGIVLALIRAPVALSALAVGVIELVFLGIVLLQAKRIAA